MTDSDIATYEAHLATLADAELIALWEAVEGDPTEQDLLALGEIERRNLDL